MTLRSLLWVSALLAPAIAGAGTVATAPVTTATKEESNFDKIWGLATWYDNKENPVIQKFSFTGRAQIDLFHVDNAFGDKDDWNFRRLRLGAKAKMFNNFTVHGEIDANGNDDGGEFYQKLTDAYIMWEADPMFKLTLGKHGMPFTLDGATSSKELITIDRSNVANNMWFTEEYLPGVSVSGDNKTWNYRLGVFSNGTANKEFGDFDATFTVLASIGHTFKDTLGAEKLDLRADYVYQDPTDAATTTFTRKLENIGALVANWENGPFAIATGITAATGYGSQSDLFGFDIMPSFYIIEDKLQAVARYSFLSSADANGVRYARYDTETTSARGDQYQDIYAGLNYYIYGNKLKVQGGVQYSMMDGTSAGDADGWQAVLGLRLAW